MISGHLIQECNLKSVPSRRRNEVLADVFARLHYMDRRGSGIGRMLEPYKGNEKQPTFYSNAYMFLVTFPNCNYGVEGLADLEPLTISKQEPNTSTEKPNTSTVQPNTLTTEPNTSEKEKAVSDKLYHKIETYLIQHPNAFQQKNRELLLDFVQQKEGSFRRKELCQTYDISSSQAARLLQRCLELGWVQRERFGVYHFVQDKKGGE